MKKISRRSFLQITGLAAGASALPMPVKWLGAGKAEAFMQTPNNVPLYAKEMRAAEIPIAIPNPLAGEGAMDDNATGFPWTFPKSFIPGTGAPVTGVRHYTFNNIVYQDKILPDACYPTTGVGAAGTHLYGFQPGLTLFEGLSALGAISPANPFYFNILGGVRQPMKHLAGIMVWEGGPSGKPVQFTMKNDLPLKHILPNDLTVPGANLGDDRWTTHVHGGLMPWICDGGPFDWYSSSQRAPSARRVGPSFINNQVLREGADKNIMTEGEFYMNPDKQSARFIWYHDHSWGITRINAYAGAASGILIRDDFERKLVSLGVPTLLEESLLDGVVNVLEGNPSNGNWPVRELPLVFQDKIFVGSNIKLQDSTWTGPTYPGSLWYPHTYEQSRWRRLPKALSLPKSSVIAEMFGDTMLVNGASSPYLTVEPRRYRFRLLNACNARFLNLQLYVADGSPTGITLDPVTQNPTNAAFVNAATGTSDWLVLGYECGFLTNVAAVPSNKPYIGGADSGQEQLSLLVGCAERPDVIVDFSNYAGKTIILYNDAAGPFPQSAGDPRNDYFPGLNNGNPQNIGRNKPANDLYAKNTRCIMKFVVGATASTVDPPLSADLAPGKSLQILENVGLGQVWNMETIRFTQKADASYVINKTGDGLTLNWTSIDGVTIDRFNKLSLDEEFDDYGRLQQAVGSLSVAPAGLAYSLPPEPNTDYPTNLNTEVWAIWNTTADVHPMHFHMSNWIVLGRQTHDNTKGSYNLTGPLMGPRSHEFGYKETVLCYPGEVTYLLGRWDIPAITGPKLAATAPKGFHPPSSPRFPGENVAETVWHCHILEHEEHDMMRPVLIKGITPGPVP